ncbi:hypothetical protein J5N97_010912 [Dioscorea zingiberensis]|uniref:Uncharacterized protein n=1 Tax=Dioscorea zingiberensis TaxID=325984 RepID=A0A9D5D177_9LILI|nr:hypothetical protein J5N97_010912 [Dioscorea zingiberensis]
MESGEESGTAGKGSEAMARAPNAKWRQLFPASDDEGAGTPPEGMPLYLPEEKDQRLENEDWESASSAEGGYTSDTEHKNASQSGLKGSSDGKYDSDDEIQKELMEVTRRVNEIKNENHQLRCVLRSLEEQCMQLESENASIVEKLKQLAGSDADVASLLADMGVDLSEGDSPKDKIIIWPTR